MTSMGSVVSDSPFSLFGSLESLAVETLGTRSRLAATVANFKADVGGAEFRAAWGWAGETAPTWFLWSGRDRWEDEEDSDGRAESPTLLKGAESRGLDGPEGRTPFMLLLLMW